MYIKSQLLNDVDKCIGVLDVRLILCENKNQLNTVNHIIDNYHSYIPTHNSVGRRVDWLISVNGEIVGMIGIGSSTYPPPKDLLIKLGISMDEYRNRFNSIANNWRFCITKSIPNLGTRVLKLLRNNCKKVWKDKYGDELEYLITFVGANHNGAVYRADNWELIGETSGLPEHLSVSMKWDNKQSISQKFVKPNGENKKLIFLKKL